MKNRIMMAAMFSIAIASAPATAIAAGSAQGSQGPNIGSVVNCGAGGVQQCAKKANGLRTRLQTQAELLDLEIQVKSKLAKLAKLDSKIKAPSIKKKNAQIKRLNAVIARLKKSNKRLVNILRQDQSRKAPDSAGQGHGSAAPQKRAAREKSARAMSNMYVTSIFGAGRRATATVYYRYNIIRAHVGTAIVPNIVVKKIGGNGIDLYDSKTGVKKHLSLTTREFAYNQTLEQLASPSRGESSRAGIIRRVGGREPSAMMPSSGMRPSSVSMPQPSPVMGQRIPPFN